MSDVWIVVQNEKKELRIPAHRLLLSAASPVFRSLLYEQNCRQVELLDSSPEAVLEFLRFLYTDHVTLSAEIVVEVLSLAKEFVISSLQRSCEQFLRNCLNGKNVLIVWKNAKRLGIQDWIRISRKVIQIKATEALSSRYLLKLDFLSLQDLLEDDLLRAPEVVVFSAACRWAKSQCLRRGLCPTRQLIRDTLGSALQLIRFPLMTDLQLRQVVAKEGVLQEEVLRSLLKGDHIFSSCPRAFQRLQTNLLTVQRFHSFDNQLSFRKTKRSLLFSADKDVFVFGLGVYGPRRATPLPLQISFSITRVDSSLSSIVDSSHSSAQIRSDISQPIINLRFDEPFEVSANRVHRISATVHVTKESEIDFFYGIRPISGQKVKDIVFSFLEDDEGEELKSRSLPATPQPPPRPPPPKEYRRASRLSRLKRALSFSDKERPLEAEETPSSGQIAMIQFFA